VTNSVKGGGHVVPVSPDDNMIQTCADFHSYVASVRSGCVIVVFRGNKLDAGDSII